MRQVALFKGLQDSLDENFGCTKCPHYRKSNWNFSMQIHNINLSVYPSPCQCRCFYCDVDKSVEAFKKNSEALSVYEKLFDMLNFAKKNQIIYPKATWHLATGEITIHPYKKRFIELTSGERVTFYSNMFIFDKDIARELQNNPHAQINISIDCGTPETWHKVKGVNNFHQVINNLKAYRRVAQNAEQIQLKYILFPSVNDSDEDFLSLIGIMRSLNLTRLVFSRDIMPFYDSKEARDNFSTNSIVEPRLPESAARFMAVCSLYGIKPEGLGNFTDQERIQTITLAQKILQSVG